MNVAKILKNPDYFRTISNPSHIECLAAIRANPENIQYVDLSNPKLEDLQVLAVSKKPECLKYIVNQSDTVCVAAIGNEVNDGLQSIDKIIPLINNWSERVCLAALSLDANLIQQLPIQTREICLLAVTAKPDTLQYIHEQTYEICLAAIRVNINSFVLVRNKTLEICMKAVEIHGNALQVIDNQTPEMCLIAVKTTPSAIQFVQDQTPELCELVVSNDPKCIKYIRNQTFDLCWLAVSKDVSCLRYVQEKTRALYKLACDINRNNTYSELAPCLYRAPDDVLCTIALKPNRVSDVSLMYYANLSKHKTYNPNSLCYSVNRPSLEVISWAIMDEKNTLDWYKESPKTEDFQILYVSSGHNRLKDIENPSEEVCVAAVIADPSNLKYAVQTERVFLAAIEYNADAIKYIPDPHEELCTLSIQHRPNSLKYIQNQTFDMCRLAVYSDPLSFQWIKSDEHKIKILGFGKCTKNAASMIIDLSINNHALT